MSPQGTFTTALADLDGKHIVGIAAGSGITPLMALAHDVLAASDTSRFTLVYTNRSTLDVMFLEELADLKDRYPARLALHHVLSREQRSAPLLSGRIDEAKLRHDARRAHPARRRRRVVPLRAVRARRSCAGTRSTSAACRPIASGSSCSRPATRAGRRATSGARWSSVPTRRRSRIEFTLDGQSRRRSRRRSSANESILNAALRVRPDVPFACTGGVCGTCRARLLEGEVRMTENYALEPDELERGYVLTCQSHPLTDRVVVDYDV